MYRMTRSGLVHCVCLGLLLPPLACRAADATLPQCAALEDREARLKCYDSIARPAPAVPDKAGTVSAPEGGVRAPEGYLTETWNLGVASKSLEITDIRPHRPTYVLLARWSDNVNQQPSSPAPGHSATAPFDLDPEELKFQLSFKSELVSRETFESFGFDQLRFWFAYTQQSLLQLYNSSDSRPFRETNYEPEFILTYSTANPGSGLKLVNLGVVHQSNGRPEPGSRSWERVYLQGGWEWGRLSLLARSWWTFEKEDNPDIDDYVGRADAVIRWDSEDRSHMVSLLLRHNLKFGQGRGFLQLDWRPIKLSRSVGVHVQLTSGYGESLIDYNHRQNTVGVGLSIIDWK